MRTKVANSPEAQTPRRTRPGQTVNPGSSTLEAIGRLADERGTEIYLVGGYVRDLLMKRPVKDADICVIGDGVAFARAAGRMLGNLQPVVFEKFGTAMLPWEGGQIEFVGARSESYDAGSRKPSVKPASLGEDLARRDFTVNAMAVSLNAAEFGRLHDPFGGQSDIAARILKTPLDPEQTFTDDPLRMMRAARFASQLGFDVDEASVKAMTAIAERLDIVSRERVADEFLKIMASPAPSTGLALLQRTGLTKRFFPELDEMVGVEQRKDYHHKDVFLHTLKVLDNICQETTDVWLRFAALVHDIAKPRTKAFRDGVGWTFHGHEDLGARMMKSIFRRLRLPTERLAYVEKLVRLHLRPMVLVSEEVTDSAVRRLLFDAGKEVDDLMTLCRADITSQNPQRVAKFLRNYDVVIEKLKEVEEKDRVRSWQPPVRGEEIMQVCGIPPGPLVGVLKKAVEDAVLDGSIPNEHDPALAYLLKVKDDIIAANEGGDPS